MFPRIFFALTLLFAAPLAAATDPSLPPAVLQQLLGAQDAYYALNFDQAEGLASAAVQAAPEHPLPRIFLCGALLNRLQEEQAAKQPDPAGWRRFHDACKEAIAVAQARLDQGGAGDPHAQLYLGTAIGARGLGHLTQGYYLPAYGDGKAAEAHLKEAVRLDPSLDEAYAGLGQYAYYCGHLAGVLRVVLDLHGDSRQGLAWLERCAHSPGYAHLSAAMALARVYAMEEIDYPKAAVWVLPLLQRYPRNHDVQEYALRTARGLGSSTPEAQALLALAALPWDDGWRPPDYARAVDPRPLLSSAQAGTPSSTPGRP